MRLLSLLLSFFGVIFNENGTQPSKNKVEALRNMPISKDVNEARSFLGMAQYSAQYIPQFSSLTAPLRELTKSSVKWKWGKEQAEAFEVIRQALSHESVLGYYKINQETRLTVDGGPKGLGLILSQRKLHGWQAIACHSRSLTETEQKYSQLEREALAIRWACERCYSYLVGSQFTVVTDHKPLVPFFNNPHSKPPIRLEKWLLYLQQFDFKLIYSPGKDNIADYLFTTFPSHISRREAEKQKM